MRPGFDSRLDALNVVSSGADAREPEVLGVLPVRLSSFTTERRLPLRPVEHQGPDFRLKYDDDTLIYEAMVTSDANRLVLLCPPFNNLGRALRGMRVLDGDTGAVLPHRTMLFDRHNRIVVDQQPRADFVWLETSLGMIEVPVVDAETWRFRGRRVLLTKSKDNDIDWILDWVRFHRDCHGADAVLVYDNGSTRYTRQDLATALKTVAGVASAVVDWPFKFGPQGLDATHFWDSDYCEHAILEHARWRFLGEARSVLHCDVDELVLSMRGGLSAFAVAEWLPHGFARFYGRWVPALKMEPSPTYKARRHRDFTVSLKSSPGLGRRGLPIDQLRCPAKWAVVPRRTPMRAQWRTHGPTHWAIARLPTPLLSYRHFRALSTNWKYDRNDVESFNPAHHRIDAELVEHFARVNWTR
ncbi:MAG: hypothetical protein RL291_1574 [Pseudomonadota bacterium]